MLLLYLNTSIAMVVAKIERKRYSVSICVKICKCVEEKNIPYLHFHICQTINGFLENNPSIWESSEQTNKSSHTQLFWSSIIKIRPIVSTSTFKHNSLNIATMLIYFWEYSEIDSDGNYVNNMGLDELDPPFPITMEVNGKYNASTGVLDGKVEYLNNSYPLTATIEVNGNNGIINAMNFNGTEFDSEAIGYLNAMPWIYSSVI